MDQDLKLEKKLIEQTLTSGKYISYATSIRPGPCFSLSANVILDFPNIISSDTINAQAFTGSSCVVKLNNMKTWNKSFLGNADGLSTSLVTVELFNVEDITATGIIPAIGSGTVTQTNFTLKIGNKIKTSAGTWFSGTKATFKNIYLYYEETDTPLIDFSTIIVKGASKSTMAYYFYTNNSTVRAQLKSAADSATTINVYHLDGTNW